MIQVARHSPKPASSPTNCPWSLFVHPTRLLRLVGPGLVTGAADDDPSGIATYSQIGAQFGFAMLWMLILTYPIMVAIQEASAWIACVSGAGLAHNLRLHYPPFRRTDTGWPLCRPRQKLVALQPSAGHPGGSVRLRQKTKPRGSFECGTCAQYQRRQAG